MKLTPKNWTLNTYTNETWTDLVTEPEPAVIATLVLVNSGAAPVAVGVRLSDGVDGIATIVPAKTLAVGDSYILDMRSINVLGGQSLQVKADVAGAEFLASGVVKVPDPVI